MEIRLKNNNFQVQPSNLGGWDKLNEEISETDIKKGSKSACLSAGSKKENDGWGSISDSINDWTNKQGSGSGSGKAAPGGSLSKTSTATTTAKGGPAVTTGTSKKAPNNKSAANTAEDKDLSTLFNSSTDDVQVDSKVAPSPARSYKTSPSLSFQRETPVVPEEMYQY